MTKKGLFLPVALLAAFSLFAQPTLQNNVLPNTGDVMIRYLADPINMEPGKAGANQVWDFTNLQPLAGTKAIHYEYVTPTSAPHSTAFPTANLVCKTNADQVTYAYYNKDNTQWSLLGETRPNYWVEYNEPAVALQTPLHFTGQWQGDYKYTSNLEDGRMVYSSGQRSATYDAYGTLKTPTATFSNAMRVRYESSQVDSTTKSDGIVMINQAKTIIYNWFVANQPDVVVSMYYTYMVTETRVPGFKATVIEQPWTKGGNYVSAVTTNAAEISTAPVGITITALGPNPVSDQLLLLFSEETPRQSLQILITDATGKAIETRTLRTVTGDNTLTFSVNQLAAGNYFLTLGDGKRRISLPWVKQ